MRKIDVAIVGIAVVLMSLSGLVMGDTTNLDGTFDPNPTGVSANLWNVTVAWGSLATSGNETGVTQINNTGDIPIDAGVWADDTPAMTDCTLVIEADNDALDEVACLINTDVTSWGDIPTSSNQTNIKTNIPPSASNTSSFALNILGNPVGWTTDHGSQTLSMTVTYVEHT